MGLFHRKQHKLPTFPKTIKKVFKEYCLAIPQEKIASLREKVLEEVAESQNRIKNGNVNDVKMAEEISTRCLYLLEHYNEFSAKEQKLIIGAVCYFAISDDPISEEIFACGYDDDAQVVNYVLEELNINDMFIKISD